MNLSLVKFQKNQSKTVGGVPYTRYLPLKEDGMMDGRMEGLNAKYYVHSFFFEKAGEKVTIITGFNEVEKQV